MLERRRFVQPPDSAGWSFFALKLFCAVAVSGLCTGLYELTNWLSAHRSHVGTLCFAWERRIPFVAAMIVPYVSLDLLFFFAFLICTTRVELMALVKRLLFGEIVGIGCFLMFPLRMMLERPRVAGMLGLLYRFQDAVDRPYNLLPSLHIVECVVLAAVYLRHVRWSWARGII